MTTSPSKTPEGQEEKPNQPNRFIIAMIPAKKNRCHHHPRSDEEMAILLRETDQRGMATYHQLSLAQ